jgi:hypothetical protein
VSSVSEEVRQVGPRTPDELARGESEPVGGFA